METPNDTELETYRASLDNLDRMLILLLAERFRVTERIGHYKKRRNLPPRDEAREENHLGNLAEIARESGLDPAIARQVLRTIIDAVVENHARIRDGG